MKTKPTPTIKLRRSALAGVIGGWLLAGLFAVMAVASIYLRNAAVSHWTAEQVKPLQRDCLDALASSPALAERFQRFGSLFDFATSMAQDLMLWFAFFSSLVAFMSVLHALFAQNVLRHMNGNGVHNQQVLSPGSPAQADL
jgi:hypothetical protein